MGRPLVLVHPPFAKACEPGPGILTLAGHLRARGVEVRLVDANLEAQEILLSPESLAESSRSLADKGAAPRHVTSGRRAAGGISRALGVLRDPLGYGDAASYRAALATLGEAHRLLSRAGGYELSASDFRCPGLSPLSSGDLLRIAQEPDALPVAGALKLLVPRILAGYPGAVGFSVSYLSQALCAFALAGLARRAGYDGLLLLGGGLPSSWVDRLSPGSAFFQVWDGVVQGPGEEALERLAADRGYGGAQGLLAPRLGEWNPPAPGARPRVCFEPDPEGLPWSRYLAPGPMLPLSASRGCYWRRCAFCPEAAQARHPFRAGNGEAIARAILRARDRHGFRKVHLTDDAVPPAALRRLSRALRGEGISWYGFARLEAPLLDPAFAEELALGGCSMLQLGVETACQRLLDLLGKGTRAEAAGPTLRNLAAAGIRTYVYLLFGLPSETEAEARQTIRWAADCADSITFANLSLLNLPRGSAIERAPERYGVGAFADESGLDLSLYRGFSGSGSLDRRAARRILGEARSHPTLRPVLARVPLGLTSNHAAYAPLELR